MSENRKHSVVGASSAHRWIACPASVQMSEGIAKTQSIHALIGTVCHDLAEKCHTEGLDPFEFVGKQIQGVEITDELADGVSVYLNYLEEVSAQATMVVLEEPFHLKDVHPLCFGTNDACVGNPFEFEIIDLKMGKGHIVEVKNNPQLMYYALGALPLFDTVDKIKLTIVQPRAYHKDGVIRSWVISREELLAFKAELRKYVLATQEENPKIVAGEHCFFCPAYPTCKVAKEKTYGTVDAIFGDLPQAQNAVPLRPLKFKDVNSMTVKEMAEVLFHADFIDGFLAEVRKRAEDLALQGTPILGHKLVKKRADRVYTADAEKEIVAILGDEAYEPRKILGITKLEATLSKRKMKKPDREALFAKITNKPDKGLVLVSLSDKREEVKSINANDMFQSLPSEISDEGII